MLLRSPEMESGHPIITGTVFLGGAYHFAKDAVYVF